jgi:hypothetical protein
MTISTASHIGFSDESDQNTGRYHSISFLSMKCADSYGIESEIGAVIREKTSSEFKWSEVRSDKHFKIAMEVSNICFKNIESGRLRVDVLIWDTEDRRHSIIGRNDNENFQKMYIHIVKNVLHMRWASTTTWKLHPDQKDDMDWVHFENILKKIDIIKKRGGPLLSDTFMPLSENAIRSVEPLKSNDKFLLQAADLFAGVGVYSYKCIKEYCIWKNNNPPQATLFSLNEESTPKLNSAIKVKSQIMSHILTESEKRCLGAKLVPNVGIQTKNPNTPLNFWLYNSVRSNDYAPIRVKK